MVIWPFDIDREQKTPVLLKNEVDTTPLVIILINYGSFYL